MAFGEHGTLLNTRYSTRGNDEEHKMKGSSTGDLFCHLRFVWQ